MRLERIVVDNIRGKHFEIKPEKVNTYFASNGAGKTTLQDGIRYALSGLLPKDIEGQPHAEVVLESGFSFTRDKACKINGKKVALKALNESISVEVGIPLDSVKISSSSDVLLAKKPEEFLSILMDYIPEELDIDKLKGFFNNLDPETEGILENSFPKMPDTFRMEELDHVGDKLFAERKLMNAELSQKKALLESIHNLQAPSRTLEEIEKDLNEAKLAEQDSIAFDKKKKAYEDAAAKQVLREKQIEELRKKAEAISERPVSQAQIDSYEKQKSDNDQRLMEANKQIITVNANIRMLQETLDNLDKPVCPISKRLICTTDKTNVKNEMSSLLKSNQEMKAVLEDAVSNALERQKVFRQQKEEFDRINKRLVEKQQLIQQAQILTDNPIPLPEKPLEVDSSMNIPELISALQKEQADYIAFSRKNALEKEVNLLSSKIKLYAELITSLKDKGEVKSKVIAFYFGIFEGVCNARASQFAPGYSIEFIANGGVEPYLKTPANGDYYPLSALSSGERMVGAFLLMDMLNQLSQTRLMFLDNIEILDTNTLESLRKLIENPAFQDAYDHIFIMGVDHPEVIDIFDGIGQKVA